MDYSGPENGARTNAEQSETGGDFRVSHESELGPEMFREWAQEPSPKNWELSQPKRKPFEGYVYFIGGDCECIKIGYARDPQKRLSALRVGSPVPLFLLAAVAGHPAHEKEYHRQFRKSWSHGEWFKKTPQLLSLIEAIVREQNHERRKRGLPNI